MKKYLFVSLLAALAIVGCAKVNPDDGSNESEQEIAFQANKYVDQTKADSHGHLELTGTFNVNAYYTGSSDWSAASRATAVKYMPGVEISKQEGVWKSVSGHYYWPKTGKLSFIGYKGWSNAPQESTTLASMLTFTQAIAVDSDPMVSDMALNLSDNPAATHFVAGVPLLFHHTAAKVAFTGQAVVATGDGAGLKYEVSISNVTIKQMYTTNTYTVNCTNATIVGSWSNSPSVPADRTIISSAQTLTGSAASVGSEGTVLPQSVSALKAQVTYTITVKNASTDAIMAQETFSNVELSLAAGDITAWLPNTKYTYNILISPVSNEIKFDPAVEDWSHNDATDEAEISD